MNEETSKKQDMVVAGFLATVVLGLIIALALFVKNVNSDVDKDLLYSQDINSFMQGGSESVKLEDESSSDVLSQNVQNPPKEEPMSDKKYSSRPEMTLNEEMNYKAVLRTNKGDITVDLFEDESPVTVNNFVFLAREGFYNGVIFHRVINDFMVQGGDPTGTGMGGPGYSFEDEINDKKLVAGSLAMANSGPNTNGSQFFIVTAASTPWLDGKHTNFGTVTEGMEVVRTIEGSPTGQNDKPLETVLINSIEIIEEPKS